MTINKVPGQTLQRCGLYLLRPVFTPRWYIRLFAAYAMLTVLQKKEQATSTHKVLSHVLLHTAQRNLLASTWVVQTPARLVDCTCCYASGVRKARPHGDIRVYDPRTPWTLQPPWPLDVCTYICQPHRHAASSLHTFSLPQWRPSIHHQMC